jgi:phosphopantetheine--protein transferase-like protein
MIFGIGTDLVATERFIPWTTFNYERLMRIFSPQEIADATTAGVILPEKLAVRFAAKEAFYKALSAAMGTLGKTMPPMSLLALCGNVHVVRGHLGAPYLLVNWGYLNTLFACTLPSMTVHVSLSHEKTVAVAFVVISESV